MNIEYLMWRDITISHIRSGKKDVIPCGVVDIVYGVIDIATIKGYTSNQGTSTASNYVMSKPKLLRLTSTGIELEARFLEKGRYHKVNISAKF